MGGKIEHRLGCAGSVNQPVPPTPPPQGGTQEVVALLVPFLRPTPQEVANSLLYFYIKYHLELGFAKFIQYTQVQPVISSDLAGLFTVSNGVNTFLQHS